MLDGNEGDRGVYASDSLEATLAAKAGEMDTRHVEEFLILSKTLNYTTAAQEAFIARPTLVEHIAELEGGNRVCALFEMRRKTVFDAHWQKVCSNGFVAA